MMTHYHNTTKLTAEIMEPILKSFRRHPDLSDPRGALRALAVAVATVLSGTDNIDGTIVATAAEAFFAEELQQALAKLKEYNRR
jgi:hypothetical protein